MSTPRFILKFFWRLINTQICLILMSYNFWASKLPSRLWTLAKFYTRPNIFYTILDLKILYYYDSGECVMVVSIKLYFLKAWLSHYHHYAHYGQSVRADVFNSKPNSLFAFLLVEQLLNNQCCVFVSLFVEMFVPTKIFVAFIHRLPVTLGAVICFKDLIRGFEIQG